MKHLWEVDHSYYCNEGNYYTAERVGDHHKSWAEFLSEWGDADMDYNLLFRWDWIEIDESTEECNFTGDVNYRNGTLKLFWMGQRKGRYSYSTVEVCRADEQMVIEFLGPRLQYLMELWSPLTEAEAA